MKTVQEPAKPADRGESALMISALLQERGAMTVAQLAQCLREEPGAVRRLLEAWADRGCVEVIRPVRSAVGERRDREELLYYRWRRTTDGDHIWQQELRYGSDRSREYRLEHRLLSSEWASLIT